MKRLRLPKPAHMKLIQAGAEIRAAPEPDPADIAFMARQLVQATLPHAAPKGDPPEWVRRNGNLTLAIRPGYTTDPATGKRVCIGYPYGTIPRLLLFWITTEALRTGSPRLYLGPSLAGFMRQLGLNPDTGGVGAKRSDAHRLREQMMRLFRATISFERLDGDEHEWLDMQIAPAGHTCLWWDFRGLGRDDLFGGWIELGEQFFKAITSAPVPADMRALKALKRSPLALDLYAFIAYRAFVATHCGKAQFVTWAQLMGQLGTDYSDPRDFRRYAKAALRKIRVAYPGLRLGSKQGGVEILPGASAVPPQRKRRKAPPAEDKRVIRDETLPPQGDETLPPQGDETLPQPIDSDM